jgi:hypothetical protein
LTRTVTLRPLECEVTVTGEPNDLVRWAAVIWQKVAWAARAGALGPFPSGTRPSGHRPPARAGERAARRPSARRSGCLRAAASKAMMMREPSPGRIEGTGRSSRSRFRMGLMAPLLLNLLTRRNLSFLPKTEIAFDLEVGNCNLFRAAGQIYLRSPGDGFREFGGVSLVSRRNVGIEFVGWECFAAI